MIGPAAFLLYDASVNPYQRIFGALNDAGVRYLVVGGVAMNLLGYPRFTGDIDILLALDEANLERIARLMRNMGYEQRIPVDVQELSEEGHVLRLMTEKNLIAYTFANPDLPQFSIDVIVGESLEFARYAKDALQVAVLDVQIPVVSIDDLIGMKRKSKRKKDADDVIALLELKGL
jgi:hypothetical protein